MEDGAQIIAKQARGLSYGTTQNSLAAAHKEIFPGPVTVRSATFSS